MDLDFATDENLRELSGEKAWEAIENFAKGQKEWDNPPNIIFEQEAANLKAQAKRLFGNEKVWVEMHRGIAWDKVGNSNPQSTSQVLPSFEENTPPVTYPDEVEGIIIIPIEVEPLNETPLEDLGLNTCNHDIPLNQGEERCPEPPIKPPSPDSFRMKEVDHLTNHTPPSPHVESFHHKDTYCYYHPYIGNPKKHNGFKPGLLGQGGSLGVDLSNWEMIEDDWKLEPKEVSFLRRRLNLPVRPKDLENGASLEEGGEECGFDSKEDEVVLKVVDVSLVDGIFDGAFGGDGDEDFVIGEGLEKGAWVEAMEVEKE
nr:ribonuclease H-like domain-containing protein [Tanacetum cinerariifolium]